MNRQRLKDKCGMRASPTAELVFENVALPAANLIGQPGGATVSKTEREKTDNPRDGMGGRHTATTQGFY